MWTRNGPGGLLTSASEDGPCAAGQGQPQRGRRGMGRDGTGWDRTGWDRMGWDSRHAQLGACL